MFKFKKEENFNYDTHLFQSIFYNVLKDHFSIYYWKKYSMFTFSNITPFEFWKPYKENKTYNIYFNSVLKSIKIYLKKNLLWKTFKFWNNEIEIIDILLLKNNFSKYYNFVTPVVISFSEETAKKYNITYKRNWKPLYWMPSFWINSLIKQTTKNIFSKYIYILKLLKENKIWYDELDIKFKVNDFNYIDLYDNKNEFDNFINSVDFFEKIIYNWYVKIRYKNWWIYGARFRWYINDKYCKIFNLVKLMWIGERTSAGFWFTK